VSPAALLWEPTSNETVDYGEANSVNEYPEVAGNDYDYDGNGCLENDGTFAYTFDTESRLLSAVSSGTSASLKYDPLGRLALKTVAGQTTRSLYCGMQRLTDYDDAGAVSACYVYGSSLDAAMYVTNDSGVMYCVYPES
jgi:hypothetical protein